MKNLALIISGVCTVILAFMFLPPVAFYILGCYQLGSWIGGFIGNRFD